MKIYKAIKIIVVLLVFAPVLAFSQTDASSPYSMFGLGTVRETTINARLQGMGGVANSMFDKGLINSQNPATYAKIDTLAFLLDVGFYFKATSLRNATIREKALNAAPDHISIAFPVFRWWKMSFSAQPYTSVNYSMKTEQNVENIGRAVTLFDGEGGLNKINWGNGFKIGEHFSLGANASFIFGSNQASTILYFPDTAYILNTARNRDVSIYWFTFDYGLMYDTKIGDKYALSVGLTYNQPANLRGNYERYTRTTVGGVEGVSETVIDTVSYDKDKVRYHVPQGVGFGFTFSQLQRWTVSFDLDWHQWSTYAVNGVISDTLQDSWRVAVGGEYMPKSTSVSKYFTRASYRAGMFYERGSLNINNHSINKFGVTLGISLPLPRTLSKVNLAVEVGQFGTKSDSLIQERYFKLVVGVSLYERWFMKRRYK